MKNKILEGIYSVLNTQEFCDFMLGDFTSHVISDTPSKEDIMKQIENLFSQVTKEI